MRTVVGAGIFTLGCGAWLWGIWQLLLGTDPWSLAFVSTCVIALCLWAVGSLIIGPRKEPEEDKECKSSKCSS